MEQETITGEEGSMGLFGSWIQRKNEGPKTSLFGDLERSLLFAPPPRPCSVGLLDEAGAQF